MSTSGSNLLASEAVPAPRRPTVARAVMERNLCPRVRVRSRPSSLTGVTMRQRRHPARVHQRGDRVDVRESIEREAIWRSDDARPAMARGSTSSGGCPNAPSGARTFKTECEARVYEVVDRDEDGMRQGRRSTRRPDHVGDRIKGMDGVTPRSEPQGFDADTKTTGARASNPASATGTLAGSTTSRFKPGSTRWQRRV